MKLCRVVLALLTLAFMLTSGWGQNLEDYQGAKVLSGRVIIKFKAPGNLTTADEIRNFRANQAAKIVSVRPFATARFVGSTGAQLINDPNSSTATLIDQIMGRDDIEYITPDYLIVAAGTVPNDPYFTNYEWYMRNTGQIINGITGIPGADISATNAWDLTTGRKEIVVAIIDPDGVNYNHEDLAANMWSAPAPYTVTVAGTQFTCPAGSHGFNIKLSPDWDCETMEYFGADHGTEMAGLIGAAGNNGNGVVGVLWNTSIIFVKMIPSPGVSDAMNAVEYLIRVKQAGVADIRVISNSYFIDTRFQPPELIPSWADEVRSAGDNGMIFVAAAGNFGQNNDSSPVLPASFGSSPYNLTNVISVANTTNRDQLYYLSDYGATSVHLGAPGTDVTTTLVGGSYNQNFYPTATGTSASTAIVAGAAGLVLSRCPQMNVADLKSNLLNSVDQLPALSGLTITGGRLNLYRAVSTCPLPSLTVTPAGTGAGTVTSSPTGLSCGAACSASYPGFTSVTLTASAAPGSIFSGWGGACTGSSSTCTVSMKSNLSVTATFTKTTGVSLSIIVHDVIPAETLALVTSSPSGISCRVTGRVCKWTFTPGTSITLTGSGGLSSTGYTVSLQNWYNGPCSGSTSPTCIFTINSDTSFDAYFKACKRVGTLIKCIQQ